MCMVIICSFCHELVFVNNKYNIRLTLIVMICYRFYFFKTLFRTKVVKKESRQNTIIKRIEIAIVIGIESARICLYNYVEQKYTETNI